MRASNKLEKKPHIKKAQRVSYRSEIFLIIAIALTKEIGVVFAEVLEIEKLENKTNSLEVRRGVKLMEKVRFDMKSRNLLERFLFYDFGDDVSRKRCERTFWQF